MVPLNVPRNSKSNELVAAKPIIKTAMVMPYISKSANNVALITSAMMSATLEFSCNKVEIQGNAWDDRIEMRYQ